MPIPRNINGSNPADVVKDGAVMDDHQNILLENDEFNELGSIFDNEDSLPDLDGAFEDDEEMLLSDKAQVSEEVKNLDENELDKLLGIDEDFEDLDQISEYNDENFDSNDYNLDKELTSPEIDIISDDESVENEKINISEIKENFSNNDLGLDESDIINFTDDEDEEDYNKDEESIVFEEDEIENELNADDDVLVFDNTEIEHEEENDNVAESMSEIRDFDNQDEDTDDEEEVDFETLMARLNDEEEARAENASNSVENSEEDNEEDFELLFIDDEEDTVEDDTDEDSDDFSIAFNNDDDEEIYEKPKEDEDYVFFDDEEEDSEEEDTENEDWTFDSFEDDTAESSEEDETNNDIPVLSKKKKKNVEDNEETESVDPENQSNPKDNSNSKKRTNSILEKLMLIKSQIMADIQGNEIPSKLEKTDDHIDEEDDKDSNDEEGNTPKGKKKKGQKPGNPLKSLLNSPLFKIFSPFKKLYMMIVKFCFSLLNFVLGVLSKIPIIGKIVKPVLSASKALEKIATYMPILLIIVGLVIISYMSVPRTYSNNELPDSGGVAISSFAYKDGTASAEIHNTGDVILSDMTIEMEIYTLQPSINPKTWIFPKLDNSCSVNSGSVDIESSAEISVSCQSNNGYLPRVSAKII